MCSCHRFHRARAVTPENCPCWCHGLTIGSTGALMAWLLDEWLSPAAADARYEERVAAEDAVIAAEGRPAGPVIEGEVLARTDQAPKRRAILGR